MMTFKDLGRNPHGIFTVSDSSWGPQGTDIPLAIIFLEWLSLTWVTTSFTTETLEAVFVGRAFSHSIALKDCLIYNWAIHPAGRNRYSRLVSPVLCLLSVTQSPYLIVTISSLFLQPLTSSQLHPSVPTKCLKTSSIFNESLLVLSLDFCFAVKNPVKLCLVPVLMPTYLFLNILFFALTSMLLRKLLNYGNIMSVISRYICVKPSFAGSCLIFLRYWILLVTPTPFTCLVLNSRTTSNLFVLALLRSLFLQLTAGVFSVPKKKTLLQSISEMNLAQKDWQHMVSSFFCGNLKTPMAWKSKVEGCLSEAIEVKGRGLANKYNVTNRRENTISIVLFFFSLSLLFVDF